MANEKRLIDANMLKANFPVLEKAVDDLWPSPVVRRAIDNAPTVDAVEVVHGRWEERYAPNGKYVAWYGFYCSVCGKQAAKSNYCPKCGAKMDGDGNG